MRCGKSVSTGFTPEPTDTPDGGIIVRAWVECPECIEAQAGVVARGVRRVALDTEACAAKHPSTGAVCERASGHHGNHRGPFSHGITQWPYS